MTHALLRFASGVSGSLEANWAATGRIMGLSFEITGTKGAIAFSQEHMNDLLAYSGFGATAGYRRIEAGPSHPPYSRFCPVPGHQLGFNDRKVIEVAELIAAHTANGPCMPDFREALAVQRTVEAMQDSSKARGRVQLREREAV